MIPLLRIASVDGVAVALTPLSAGVPVDLAGQRLVPNQTILAGHKLALRPHLVGESVVKYGYPIGVATAPIAVGDHVHDHNLASSLTPDAQIPWVPRPPVSARPLVGSWWGFRRCDGRCATRNELWIIPTVGCVARTTQALAEAFRGRLAEFPGIDAVVPLPHPLGCSQLGDDLADTRRVLAALASHPNAGAVLLVGLGCENNRLDGLLPLVDRDPATIRVLATQAAGDELAEGLALLEELASLIGSWARQELPLSALSVGLKCGGSDGLSGITANPLVGRFATAFCAAGGQAALTEIPEAFGAEPVLFNRAVDRRVFDDAVALVREFRSWYASCGVPVSGNPSPGNHDGGITTLEEKSLGCVQKGGEAVLTDVRRYGERLRRPGLSLIEAPGNDQVSTTALAAAGCTVVLFTTGRGTPLGTVVPTVKIATNASLARRKPGWIDVAAGVLAEGADPAVVDAGFAATVIQVASGTRTCNERNGQRDLAIFKRGVTL